MPSCSPFIAQIQRGSVAGRGDSFVLSFGHFSLKLQLEFRGIFVKGFVERIMGSLSPFGDGLSKRLKWREVELFWPIGNPLSDSLVW